MKQKNVILDEVLSFYSPQEQTKILSAYEFAEKHLQHKFRENNHPFIEHPIGVAHIIAKEIGLEYDAIISIFLHEAARFNPELLDKIPKGSIPQEILDIVTSLNNISAIRPMDTGLEAENYKRLIVSYSKDPRVTLIKLADRLEVMRNINLLPKSSQERKNAETILLYVPIAHQLGLYKLKSELEDIFFKHSEPENYRTVINKLLASEGDRKKIVSSFIEPLKTKLVESKINANVKSRTKTTYSIWKKMQKQGISFEGVQDISAMRIVIDSPPEEEHDLCWKAYSIVTEEYIPDTSRLRDWLTKPKSNGYESLHTTVKDNNGNVIEVQIRTKRMDDIAENGLAAHWSYKGVREDTGLSIWLSSVRNILESNEESSYQHTPEYFKEEVFVFTPNGELRRLPADATVLDFAFDIHTNLGLKCSGGKIGGKIASIKDKLHTGDVVEIISTKNQKPSKDWLNFVVTTKARAKIKQKTKEEELKRSSSGKELLDRRLKNWKMEIHDEDIAQLCKKYKLRSINEFYAAIGEEKIDVSEIKEFLNTTPEVEQKKEIDLVTPKSITKGTEKDFLIIDGKLGNIGYKISKCCNPIYGDDVFGFVSIKDGIKIHRISCPNATRLIGNYPYRIQKVKWRENIDSTGFQVSLKIIVDDSSVLASILSVINDFNIQLRSSNLNQRTSKGRGEYNIIIQISISNNHQLEKIISILRKTKGVITVLRG